jgi:predicted metal-dependent phosphoesterase TrpH
VIDLHLHTTASDGLLSPDALVERVAEAGVTALAVTDHDTLAAFDEAAAAASRRGLRLLTGVEVTAVDAAKDVHILGYGIDPRAREFVEFLARQRAQRIERIHRMLARLAELGMPLAPGSVDPSLEDPSPAPAVRSIGRPLIGRALVKAGFVSSVQEAFDRWLARDRPAFVPRQGAPPREVVARIVGAGGIAALAHPGLTCRDDLIPELARSGMAALEVWHSEHDAETSARYLSIAERNNLLPVGGSDFHGDAAGRPHRLGQIGTPRDVFERLLAAAAIRPANFQAL